MAHRDKTSVSAGKSSARRARRSPRLRWHLQQRKETLIWPSRTWSIPSPAIRSHLQEAVTALARPRRQDGAASRSRRVQLQGLRAARRPQGADHRRRFRHGPRGRDRICARRRRCRHQLSARGRARRTGGHRPDQEGRPYRPCASRRPQGGSLLQEAGRAGYAGPRRSRHHRQQRRSSTDAHLHPRRLVGGFRRDQ